MSEESFDAKEKLDRVEQAVAHEEAQGFGIYVSKIRDVLNE